MKRLIFIGFVLGACYLIMRPNINVRNNNPLNIRYNPNNDWVGQVGQSGGFAEFDTPVNGFRAAAKLIQTYREQYGLNSIDAIVNRWAPPSENHTEAYIDFLTEKLDKWSFTPVFDSEIPELLFYMSEFEGGKGAFSIEQARQGVELV